MSPPQADKAGLHILLKLAALVINGLFIDRVPDACPWGFEFLAKTLRREEN